MGKTLSTLAKATFWTLTAIIAASAWFIWSETPETTATAAAIDPEERAASSARLFCREQIHDQLKDPASAEWGMSSGNWYATWPATVSGETVKVQPRFRAKNSFGGLIISEWSCVVTLNGSEIRLVSLKEI